MLRIVDIAVSVIIIISEFIIINKHEFDRAEKVVSSIDYTYVLCIFAAAMIFAKYEIKKCVYDDMKQNSIDKREKENEKSIDILKTLSMLLDFVVVLISIVLIAMWKLL